MERLTGYYCNNLAQTKNYYESETLISEKMMVNKQILNNNLLNKLRRRVK